MKLMLAAGLSPEAASAVADAPSAELQQLLVAAAVGFVEAGGRITLDDWIALERVERVAFVTAGRSLRIDQAVKTGLAGQGDLAALRVQGEVDGGFEHDRALLASGVRAAVEASRGR